MTSEGGAVNHSHRDEREADEPEVTRPRRLWRVALLVSGVVALIGMLLLVNWSYLIAEQAPEPRSLRDPLPKTELYELSSWAVWAVVAFGVIAVTAYAWSRRRRESSTAVVTAMVMVGAVILLAGATYFPCRPHPSDLVPPLAWVLSIFEGEYELAGPGSRCALAFSPGFELARALALVLIAFGATAVVRVLARRSIDRWVVSWHSDVDVVVGLDPFTLPLVKALVRQRDSRPRLEEWVEPRPGWMLPASVTRPPC